MEAGPQPLILRQWKNHLPHDIVLNILARLPVKPLLRFRCVCKLWDSSITSSNFISTHLNIIINNKDHDPAYLIQTCFEYVSPKVLSCDSTFDSLFEYSVPSVFDLSVSVMVGSCNGLVCLAQYGKRSNFDAIFLWNPSIRKFKRLPDLCLSQCSNAHDSRFSTGFAYQSKTNDFKVIKIWSIPAVAEVYSLSLDSWRKVEISLRSKFVVSYIGFFPTLQFVSGALHWLAYLRGDNTEGQFLEQIMILSFDIDNEEFGEIAPPDGDKLLVNSLFVFKGNLAFITYGYPENDDGTSDSQCFIWVMKEYGVHESWNKLFSIRFENVDISFYGCTEHGGLLLGKKVNEMKVYDWNESTILPDDTAVVSLNPETLHEKDLGILRCVTNIVTTFNESLVLLDGATGLSG